MRNFEDAQNKVQRAIVEAEKFCALVAETAGKNTDIDMSSNAKDTTTQNSSFESLGPSDDEFFHLICHIDEGLISKIEAGQYVDLERLIPKDKVRRFSDETRMEWVHREGGTFLVPAQNRDVKINGVRHWEQAFRAYATIYCGANPQRSKEIWQYVAVINTATAAYSWDNVASYDYTFRHLMEFNPSRSWATTYNQMWNLCMRDPLPKNNQNQSFGSQFQAATKIHGGNNPSSYNNGGTSHNNSNGNNSNAGGQNKEVGRYCLNFNKGEKCKYGDKCRFVECCSFCDSPAHPAMSCPKMAKN